MTVEKIRELCDAQPFNLFVIHFPDGREVAVKHPDFVAFFPTGRLLVVTNEDESETIVDSMLVSDVTVKAPTRRNGKHH